MKVKDSHACIAIYNRDEKKVGRGGFIKVFGVYKLE
jgi:hypothetical protein